MPLIDMRDMLNHAYRNGYAVGGFDLASLDFIEPIVQAAENCRSPVILNLAETRFGNSEFELAMAAAGKAAQRAAVPVAIHLDHGRDHESAVRAINGGCNGVMVDASHESFPANVAQTRRVTEMAHGCGVMVEGELGYAAPVEGKEGSGAEDVAYTSVEEAKAYVARTGVDCLAVSVGTAHGRLRKPKLDTERLKRINDAVKIPLVIHGGAGLSDEQYRKLIMYGVAKIDCPATLAELAGSRLRAGARAETRGDYSVIVRDVRDGIREEIERWMRLWGSAGRAAEVLVQCQEWRPVQHVIVYNVEHAADGQVEAVMARGREVLATIPGVRRVITGWAVTDKPRYRYCWLIEFAHRAVIDSYRDHPLHRQFADHFFRPLAADRISIDFENVETVPAAPIGKLQENING